MQIALYKGPPKFTDFSHWIAHWAIRLSSFSKYSHVELVIDGVCYSSSVVDNGVRAKLINLSSGKWDMYTVNGDAEFALKYVQERLGNKYDWFGIVRFVIPFVKQKPDQSFCSEIVAGALGATNPEDFYPSDLLQFVTKD